MRPFETAAGAPVGTQRKRLGDGVRTPVKPLEFRDPYSGGVRQLHPGRDRVSADSWGFKEHPELFRVVNRGDVATATRHRQALERTRRGIERQLGRTGTTRASTSRFSLGPDGSPEWRLP
jgi:hypothetical protein